MEEESKEKPRITEEMYKLLSAPISKEAISQHPTKTFLSTIKAIYITERLNQVFGIGRWTIEHEVVFYENDYVLMQGQLIILDYDCHIPKQYGGHPTSGTNTEPADGYKSAVTDIVSKSASYLGVGIEVFKRKKTTPREPYDKKGSKPSKESQGSKKNPDKTQSQLEEIGKWLMEMADGNRNKASAKLKELTVYNEFQGFASVHNLMDVKKDNSKRFYAIYKKIEEAYKNWKAGKSSYGEEENVEFPNDDQIPF